MSIILLAYSFILNHQELSFVRNKRSWLLNFNGTYLVFHWSPFSRFLIAWLICQPCTSLKKKKNTWQVSCVFFFAIHISLTLMSPWKEYKSSNKQSIFITLLAVVLLSACSLQCANSGSATSCNKTQLSSRHSLSDIHVLHKMTCTTRVCLSINLT